MTRFSDPQILAILPQAEGGVPVAELCRELGMSSSSFYNIERYNRTVRHEWLDQYITNSIEQAQHFATQWL